MTEQDEAEAREAAEQAADRQEPTGYIVLAVQFNGRDAATATFRIEWMEGYEPGIEECHLEVFAHDEHDCETLFFWGQKSNRREIGEWFEPAWIKIPGDAYLMASWNYYSREEHEAELAAIKALGQDEIAKRIHKLSNPGRSGY